MDKESLIIELTKMYNLGVKHGKTEGEFKAFVKCLIISSIYFLIQGLWGYNW